MRLLCSICHNRWAERAPWEEKNEVEEGVCQSCFNQIQLANALITASKQLDRKFLGLKGRSENLISIP